MPTHLVQTIASPLVNHGGLSMVLPCHHNSGPLTLHWRGDDLTPHSTPHLSKESPSWLPLWPPLSPLPTASAPAPPYDLPWYSSGKLCPILRSAHSFLCRPPGLLNALYQNITSLRSIFLLNHFVFLLVLINTWRISFSVSPHTPIHSKTWAPWGQGLCFASQLYPQHLKLHWPTGICEHFSNQRQQSEPWENNFTDSVFYIHYAKR